MKILFVIDKMKNYAGIERILTCKMNYIATKTPHTVYLTTYEQNNDLLPFPLDTNICYLPLDIMMPQRSKMTFVQWMKKYFEARNCFKKEFYTEINNIRPDIVVSTVYSFQVLDIIIKSCYNKNIKTIVESHTKGETVTLSYKFRYNKFVFRLMSIWDYFIMKELKHCNCVVTLTKQDMPFWSQYAKRTKVIPNMLTIVPKKVIDYEAKRVISAGRYMTEKGFDMLLEAWKKVQAQYPDWSLHIYGSHDGGAGDYEKLQKQIVKSPITNVFLHQATTDVYARYMESDFYVMSSRFESFGLVLIEAMSCGLPVISYDCDYGPKSIINDGQTGMLVPRNNTEQLAVAICKMIENENERQRMAINARNTSVQYQPENIMPLWHAFYQSLGKDHSIDA